MKNRGKNVAVTPEEKERIRELYAHHKSIIRVAEAVGRSEYAVHCVIRGVPKINRKKDMTGFFDWKEYGFKTVIV